LVDYTIITDIYPAGEPPLEGINGRLLYDKIKEQTPYKQVIFLPKEEIVKHILETIKPHNLVVTLGAGDIVKICDELVEELRRKS
jgi:UDP-N-acetylmuramate--alanine ligase